MIVLAASGAYCLRHIEITGGSMLGIPIFGGRSTRARRSRIFLAVTFLPFISIPSLGLAAIYKCTAEDGGITYTDAPCAPDAKTQTIDLSKPASAIDSSLSMHVALAVSQSALEIVATLCAADEYSFWLKAQRGSLPERDVRTAKFIRLNKLCRSALHLSDVTRSVPESSQKLVPARPELFDP